MDESMMMPGAERFARLYRELERRHPAASQKVLEHNLYRGSRLLKGMADELKGLADQTPATLVRREASALVEVGVEAEDQAESVQDPFKLFVVGMGKAGKSTLLNALIGAQVAPEDIIPKTWKTDFYYGDTGATHVVVRYRDGHREQLSRSQAERLVAAEEERAEAALDEADRIFRNYPEMPPTVAEKARLQAEIRKAHWYQSPIREVHWHLGAQQLSDLMADFTLVDTPGLWQQLGDERANLGSFYHRADGVIWVLDTTTLSARTPPEMLGELAESLQAAGVERGENMIAVLNKIDRVEKSGGPGAVQAVVAEAQRLFGSRFLEIVPMAANTRRGLPELLAAIRQHFYSGAVAIRERSMAGGFRTRVWKAANQYGAYLGQLKQDEERRSQLSAALNRDLERVHETFASRTRAMLNGYESAVRSNMNAKMDQLLRIKDVDQRISMGRGEIFAEQSIRAELKLFVQEAHRQLSELQASHADRSLFQAGEYYRPVKLPDSALQLTGDDLFRLDGRLASMLAAIPQPDMFDWFRRTFQVFSPARKLQQFLDNAVSQLQQELTSAVERSAADVYRRVSTIREDSFAALHGPSAAVPQVRALLDRLNLLAREPFARATVADLIIGRNPLEIARRTGSL